jgi:hypothetical protein
MRRLLSFVRASRFISKGRAHSSVTIGQPYFNGKRADGEPRPLALGVLFVSECMIPGVVVVVSALF